MRGTVPGSSQEIGLVGTSRALVVAGGGPEPAAWAMLLAGFGLAGWAMRRRPTVAVRYA